MLGMYSNLAMQRTSCDCDQFWDTLVSSIVTQLILGSANPHLNPQPTLQRKQSICHTLTSWCVECFETTER